MGRVFITGFEQLKANMRNELNNMAYASAEGMVKAAEMIKQSMDTQSPTIPKKTGDLSRSWFIVSTLGIHAGKSPAFIGPDAALKSARHAGALTLANTEVHSSPGVNVEFGFSVPYAIWVHEMPEGTDWSRQGSGPKFLEKAIKANKDKIITVIQQTYLLKGYGKTTGGIGQSFRQDIMSGKFTK